MLKKEEPSIRTSPETGKPEYTMLRWVLLPFWSKNSKTRFPLINARAEGKQPFFIQPADHGYFALAGIRDHRQPELN